MPPDATQATDRHADDEPVERLAEAERALEAVEASIEERGEGRVDRLAEWHGRFDDLLERYRERASGTGRETFQDYLAFEGALDEFMDELPEDLLHRGAFEDAESYLDRRRLEEADFDRAREALAPAQETAGLLEEREAAAERVRAARATVERHRREVDAGIADLEAVLAYADVDLHAPVERLREPVEAYEDAVDEAFEAFLAEASARAVLDLVEATGAYPLVDLPEPPEALRRYLRASPAGEEPVATLLEWAGFTRSKLSHYVEDPPAFRSHVAGNRTYLARLDAEPLHVGWPPPAAESLRFRARELVSVVERFAPPGVVERLHRVRALARRDDYPTLRRAAVARDALAEADRRRLRDGTAREELEALRTERDRLTRALEAHRSP